MRCKFAIAATQLANQLRGFVWNREQPHANLPLLQRKVKVVPPEAPKMMPSCRVQKNQTNKWVLVI